jgi:hypothetical protein
VDPQRLTPAVATWVAEAQPRAPGTQRIGKPARMNGQAHILVVTGQPGMMNQINGDTSDVADRVVS